MRKISNNQIVSFTSDAIFINGIGYPFSEISAVKCTKKYKVFLFRHNGEWHRLNYSDDSDYEIILAAFTRALTIHRDYYIRTWRALTEGSNNNTYYQEYLKKNNYEEDTAITPLYIKDVSCSTFIVLSQEAHELMNRAYQYSWETNCEIPFYLFGHIENHGKHRIIVFDRGKYSDKDLERHHASFNSLTRGINAEMNRFLVDNDAESLLDEKEIQIGNQFRRAVRCYGHTHPPRGESDCFSFVDLVCAVDHTLLNELFSSNEVDSLDVLITTKGDLNFIKYENNELFECFLKYPNVFVKRDDGTIKRLKSYENGNYSWPI